MIKAAISIPMAVAPTATPNPAIPPGNWEPFEVSRGDRIAQLVPAAVQRALLAEVDALDDTDRGAGGFGSTGR